MEGLLELIIPKEILTHFVYERHEEVSNTYIIYLVEKNDVHHIPKAILHDGKAVLDGYMNPIELQAFPLKGKEVFIQLKRRRWKVKGTKKGYSNEYKFNPEGVKATREFGAFLKDIGRI